MNKIFWSVLGLLSGLLFFSQTGLAADCGITVDPARELSIVDPLVLDDARANPGGPWHFSSLLKQMLPADASDADLSDFIVRWLGDSKAVTKLNGFDLTFPGLALGERTVCSWLDETGDRHCTPVKVDPARVPYHLIGIINRLDLHGHGPDHAEGRFVFGALSHPTANPVSDPAVTQLPETVIFEYTLPLASEADVKAWAQSWHDVASHACTTKENCEAYRVALEALTRRFSSRGLVASRPNGNSIGQIRTSHLAPGSGTIWQFRQFELTGTGKTVSLTSVPNTQAPAQSLDGNAGLTQFIQQNSGAILADNFVLPKQFLGGESLVDDSQGVQWQLPGVAANLRKAFSNATCNGCHGENPTLDGFFHVSPVSGAGQSRLSDFLVQGELTKRATSFKNLLCNTAR